MTRSVYLKACRTISNTEAVGRLGEGSGRPITYANLSDADFRGALIGANVPEPFADLFVQINRNARENNLAVVTNIIATITGRPARTLASFARDYAAAFTPAKA